jgi:glycosyltransferase involved in cell wall biosynthesis
VVSPRISLIVPAWNEQRLLPALLESVGAACRSWDAGDGALEVVVADNASTDATAAIAAAAGCRVAPVAPRVIAAVRNGGAAAAHGEVLAFIDADSRIHERTFSAIEDTLASPAVIAGATGIVWERWSAGIAATWAVGAAVTALTGMDAGVVFCRREDFLAVGGYNENRLFAEDVEFLLALRRRGRTRGQRLARPRGVRAVSSARKFDRHGDWHALHLSLRTFAAMARTALPGTRTRRDVVRDFARHYWYEDRALAAIEEPARPAAPEPS